MQAQSRHRRLDNPGKRPIKSLITTFVLDEDLNTIFSRFGTILSCEVIRDKRTKDSLQYAFIEFEHQKDCEQAYFKMQGVLIDDHRIHVDFSQSVSASRRSGDFDLLKLYRYQDYRTSGGLLPTQNVPRMEVDLVVSLVSKRSVSSEQWKQDLTSRASGKTDTAWFSTSTRFSQDEMEFVTLGKGRGVEVP